MSGELITRPVASNRCTEQDPEGEAARAGVVEATRRQADAGNDKRVRATDEVEPARQREQTPER